MCDYTTSSLTASLPRNSEINDARDAVYYRQGNALDFFFVSGKPLQDPECLPGQSNLGASRRDRDLCTSISLYRNCVLAVQNCRSKRAFYSGLHRSIQEWVTVLVTAPLRRCSSACNYVVQGHSYKRFHNFEFSNELQKLHARANELQDLCVLAYMLTERPRYTQQAETQPPSHITRP